MSADTTSVDHVEPSATEAAQCSDIPSCHRDAAAVLAAKYPLLLNLTWSSVPVQEISSGEASQPTDVSKSLEPAIGCWCSESFPTDGRGLLFDGLESGFLGLTPARHTAASMKAWSEGACVDDACAAAVKRVNSLVLEAFCDRPTASCTAVEAASMAEDLYKCQCAYAASGDAFGKNWRESGGEEDQARFCNFDGCAAYMSALCRVAEAGFCAERKLGDGLCPWYTDLQTLLLVVGGGVLVVLFCLCLCCFIFCCKVRCCASCWNKEEPYPDELGESSLPSYQQSGDKDRQRKDAVARTFGRPREAGASASKGAPPSMSASLDALDAQLPADSQEQEAMRRQVDELEQQNSALKKDLAQGRVGVFAQMGHQFNHVMRQARRDGGGGLFSQGKCQGSRADDEQQSAADARAARKDELRESDENEHQKTRPRRKVERGKAKDDGVRV